MGPAFYGATSSRKPHRVLVVGKAISRPVTISVRIQHTAVSESTRQLAPYQSTRRREGVEMYTLVDGDPGTNVGLPSRQEAVVRHLSREFRGSCLVPGQEGYGRGMALEGMGRLLDLWVHRSEYPGLQGIEEVRQLESPTRSVIDAPRMKGKCTHSPVGAAILSRLHGIDVPMTSATKSQGERVP